jgi:hypothetical protein
MEHVLLNCMGKVLPVPPAASEGGPNEPVKPLPIRVSTTRQGVTATNTKGTLEIDANGTADRETTRATSPARTSAFCFPSADSLSDGCQYSGAAQFFNGTASGG